MKEVERMMSVGEIIQSKKFQDEFLPKLKSVIRRVKRKAHRRRVQSTQKANKSKKVA